MWEWIEQERLAELRDVESPTIAFHIRGGDVFEADKAQVGLLQLSWRRCPPGGIVMYGACLGDLPHQCRLLMLWTLYRLPNLLPLAGNLGSRLSFNHAIAFEGNIRPCAILRPNWCFMAACTA